MKKKILSFLTSAVMAAACLGGGLSELTSRIHLVNEPLTAGAVTYGEETKYGDYLYYKTVDEDEDGTFDYVVISDCDTSATDVEIPSEIEGLPVTSIEGSLLRAGAFGNCINLESITIPDSVMNIGYNAFINTALISNQTGPVYYADDWVVNWDKDATSVEIKDGTKGIADYGFFNNKSLERITIPESLTNIGLYPFIGCTCLENINVSENNNVYCSINGVLFNKRQTELIKFPACNPKTEYSIPNSVVSIGDYAFQDCTSLMDITIPDSVTSIGDGSFSDCTSLTEITIPDSVTSIGDGSFSDCTSLTNIIIPDNLINIGEDAFSGCTSLTSISIPDSVIRINSGVFKNCSSLDSLTIPDSVTYIGSDVFYGCSSLESIIIPNSVTEINASTFGKCSSLKSITIPDSINDIGLMAFQYCTSLESITIPEGVLYIGMWAFAGCTNLASITIENSNCIIEDSIDNFQHAIPESAVIYGYENSTAQKYAENYEREFVSLGEKPAAIKGDANGDGKINAADIVLIQKCMVNIEVEIEVNFNVLDINNDGTFDVFDVILLKRIILNN